MKMTSATHPLRIDPLAVPGCPGLIGMTLCPGKSGRSSISGAWNRDLGTDLQVIRDWGASTLVTLMEPAEMASYKVGDLARRLPEGMAHHLLPIVDGGVPDEQWEQAWITAGAQIRAALAAGRKVVLHCRGGLGRTGTIAARLLVEFGMDPDTAIAAVRQARPETIENRRQADYVKKQKPIAPAPSRPYHRISPDRASRFRGCLLGGAAGDALGAPVEFMDLPAIRRAYGPGGIRDLAPAYGRLGAITDDTQLTLFTAEGLLRAHVREQQKGQASFPGIIGHAYLRWLATQGRAGKAYGFGKDGWLFTHKALFASRAPGTTCLSALMARETIAGSAPAVNGSKGCGGVMRVAPIGLYAAARGLPREQAFTWACEAAAQTHGHPTGQLPAGVLAMVICALVQDRTLPEALTAAKEHLQQQPHHQKTLEAINAAEALAGSASPDDEVLAQLGQGWVAEEALAIALCSALRAGNLEEGVIMAANITGDSDSTAAIAGNLLGAMLGVHEIPERWLWPLELREVISGMADDLATVNAWALAEPGQDPSSPGSSRERDYWGTRYPGW